MSYRRTCQACHEGFVAADPRRRYCDECKAEITNRQIGGATGQEPNAEPILQRGVAKETQPRYLTAPLCAICDRPMPAPLQDIVVGSGRARRVLGIDHPMQIACPRCKVARGAPCYSHGELLGVCRLRERENHRRLVHSYACPNCLAGASKKKAQPEVQP